MHGRNQCRGRATARHNTITKRSPCQPQIGHSAEGSANASVAYGDAGDTPTVIIDNNPFSGLVGNWRSPTECVNPA